MLKLYRVDGVDSDDDDLCLIIRAKTPREAAEWFVADIDEPSDMIPELIYSVMELNAFAPEGVIGVTRSSDVTPIPAHVWSKPC